MPLLSVIVPIYNVENYIKDCIESIIKQLPKHGVEVILINDGSEDKSLCILEELVLNLDDCVRDKFLIISQENKGLSCARNKGISEAKGKYLSFIDSDDVLLDNYFESIFEVLLKYPNIDIIKFKFKVFSRLNDFNKYQLYLNKEGFFNIDSNLIIELFNDSSWYAWSHIYNANLFVERKFPLGLNFEDVATVPYLYIKSHNIYFINNELYGYRVREGSITTSTNKNVVDKNIKSLEVILNTLLNDTEQKREFYILYIYFIRVYFDFLLRYRGVFYSYREWFVLKEKTKFVNIDYKLLFRSKKNFTYFFLYQNIGFFSNYAIKFLGKLNTFLNMFKIKK